MAVCRHRLNSSAGWPDRCERVARLSTDRTWTWRSTADTFAAATKALEEEAVVQQRAASPSGNAAF